MVGGRAKGLLQSVGGFSAAVIARCGLPLGPSKPDAQRTSNGRLALTNGIDLSIWSELALRMQGMQRFTIHVVTYSGTYFET